MRRAWLSMSAALWLAAPALAAEDAHGADASAFLWQLANLALLLTVLFVFARKPVRRFFADRREGIRSELDEASELLTQAEARFTHWQRKLVDLDTELEQIRTTARHRAQEERAHILRDAQAAAERIQQDAATAVEQGLRRARTELREEAVDLAIELATSLLREQVNAADRKRLIEEFISRVEQGATNVRGRAGAA